MNNSFPSYIYGHAFLEKLMFPSMLNKWNLASIEFADKPQTQTNTTNISRNMCREKSKQSSMR